MSEREIRDRTGRLRRVTDDELAELLRADRIDARVIEVKRIVGREVRPFLVPAPERAEIERNVELATLNLTRFMRRLASLVLAILAFATYGESLVVSLAFALVASLILPKLPPPR